MNTQADLIPPKPTPAEVLAARTAAGHSQAQATAVAGLAHAVRWSGFERGTGGMDPARWALYLLATGQHPSYTLTPR